MTKSDDFDIQPSGDREIVMTRSFDASADLVFDALTQPALVRRWLLGPPGWTMPVCEIDLKVNGAWRYVWRGEAGREFGMEGEYHVIDRPRRIVHTERFEGGESVVTSTLAEKDGKTMLTMTMLFDSKEARDGAIESGMGEGVAVSYQRLDDILREPK